MDWRQADWQNLERDSWEIVKVAHYSIEARREGDAVVWLKNIETPSIEGPLSMATLLERLPELLDRGNIAAYAAVALYCCYGNSYVPLVDDDTIEAYRAVDGHLLYPRDLSSIALPRVSSGSIIFFARARAGLGFEPYRVTLPYPYDPDKYGKAELLPPSTTKPWPVFVPPETDTPTPSPSGGGKSKKKCQLL
jgi:hypothetical protein